MEIVQVDQFDKNLEIIELKFQRKIEIPIDMLHDCFEKYGNDVYSFKLRSELGIAR